MLHKETLAFILRIHDNTNSCLMVDDSSSWIIFNIISAIETTVSEDMLDFKGLWGGLHILLTYLASLNCFFPGFLHDNTLFSNGFFKLKIIVFNSMLDSLFNFRLVRIPILAMPINFFPDIGINKIINFFLEI